MFENNVLNNILNEFKENNNSHSYIFYTNDFFACKSDIEVLVRKVFNIENLNSVLSDFIVVEKSENKNILKDEVTKIKDMFQNKSYLNGKRIYLIEEAHKLNSTSANIILKFLEEPMDGIVALFITTNLDAVLPTIKSRCQIINVFYESKIKYNLDDIKLIDKLFNENKYINIFVAKKNFEKYDRNKLIELFNNYLLKCYNELESNNNLLKIKVLNKVIGLLNSNVNIDYIFDYLILEGSE